MMELRSRRRIVKKEHCCLCSLHQKAAKFSKVPKIHDKNCQRKSKLSTPRKAKKGSEKEKEKKKDHPSKEEILKIFELGNNDHVTGEDFDVEQLMAAVHAELGFNVFGDDDDDKVVIVPVAKAKAKDNQNDQKSFPPSAPFTPVH